MGEVEVGLVLVRQAYLWRRGKSIMGGCYGYILSLTTLQACFIREMRFVDCSCTETRLHCNTELSMCA